MVAVLFLSSRATDEGSRFGSGWGMGGASSGSCRAFLTFELQNFSGREGSSEGVKLAPDIFLQCSASLMWY